MLKQKRFQRVALIVLSAIMLFIMSARSFAAPASQAGWTLVWEDQFSGTGAPSSTNWNYHVGNGFNPGLAGFDGWGNGEWEWYRPENCYQSGGNLVMRADYNTTPTNIAGRDWYQRSCRITTDTKRSIQYGAIEARIQMPNNIGTWPAFWMMGDACDDTSTSNYSAPITYYDTMASNWASCGEVDIMEHRNTETQIFNNLFWDTRIGVFPWSGTTIGNNPVTAQVPGGVATFHVYRLEWTTTEIRWLLDGAVTKTESITAAEKEEFHKPFHLIMNLALSGAFTGGAAPNQAEFPLYMNVDYVRVYQAGGTPPPTTPPPTTPPPTTPPPTGNLALNKPATGSAACNTSETPAKAVNGSVSGGNTDKFCSAAGTKFLQVDLGSNYSVTQFIVKHAGAGGEAATMNTRGFNIQTSTDNVNWSTAVTVTANTANISTHSITARTARYVKLNITQADQGTGGTTRIYEFEVYGAGTPPPTTPPPTTPPPTTPATDYTQGVTSLNSTQARIWFRPTTASTLVDVHYLVSGLGQQNFRMTNNAGTWEQTVSNLTNGSVIEYWFTYEKGGPLFDTGHFFYTHGGSPTTPPPTTPPPTTPPPTTPPSGLPSPWVTADIGAVAAAGSATHSNGVFTVRGSGADIWNAADEFRFVYQPMTGNGTITARVASQTNTNAWAKAGVMIRDTTGAGSTHASMFVTPTSGTSFQRRSATNGTSASTAGPTGAAPRWVRMTRSGTTFTAATSPDGVTWTTVGTATITMGNTVQVGLAVTSHADGTISTATFDNVTVSGGTVTPPPTTPPPTTPPPTGCTSTGPTGSYPLCIVNNTGGRWTNSQIYFTILGMPTPGQWHYVRPDGTTAHINAADASAPNRLTKNGVNYPNMSFTMAQVGGKVMMPTSWEGGRAYISLGSPMYIPVSPDNMGWGGPDPLNPTDPNNDVYYDWYEFTYKYQLIPFGGNTTQVDIFGFPMTARLQQSAIGYDQTVGITQTRAQVMSGYTAAVGPAFDPLASEFRILAPRTSTSFRPGGAQANYMTAYIDQVWSFYTSNQFNLTRGGVTFTGQVISNRLQFTRNGAGPFFINKPTSFDVFACAGALASGSDQEKELQAELCAAFHRGVALNTSQWYTPSAYYTGSIKNDYSMFFHQISLQGRAYGFPYDDVNDQSSVKILPNANPPSALTISIGW